MLTNFKDWLVKRDLKENTLGSLSNSGFQDMTGDEADEISVKRPNGSPLRLNFGQRRRPEISADPRILDQMPDTRGGYGYEPDDPEFDTPQENLPSDEPSYDHLEWPDRPTSSWYDKNNEKFWHDQEGLEAKNQDWDNNTTPTQHSSVADNLTADELKMIQKRRAAKEHKLKIGKAIKSWKNYRNQQRHQS